MKPKKINDCYIFPGSIKMMGKIISNYSPNSIFLVTGGRSYEKSGAKKSIEANLANFTTKRFSNFTLNPKIEDIKIGEYVLTHRGRFRKVVKTMEKIVSSSEIVSISTPNSRRNKINIKGEKKNGRRRKKTTTSVSI